MFKTSMNILMTETLTVDQAYSIGQFILSGEASEIEIASLLTALKFKGETYEIIAGFAQALKLYSKDMTSTLSGLIDVCGTGGDGSNTFNISTTVSLLLASVMTVSKHGNRSISSKSGSADVLNILKVPKPETKETVEFQLKNHHYSFLFAPYMHPNMKYVMPVRTALKIPTIFNIIGPLCNPQNVDYQVIGVYKESLLYPMAQALNHLGVKRGAVVHGHNGLDELSISGPNKVIYVINDQLIEGIIDPRDYNISYQHLDTVKGGDAKENAEITQNVLSGSPGPQQDIVALNAGLALYIGEVTATLSEGIKKAYTLLDTGEGLSVLDKIQGEKKHEYIG